MMFGTDDTVTTFGIWAGIGGLVTGVIGAIAGAYVLISNALHKNKQEKDKAKQVEEAVITKELRRLVDRQQKRIDQLEAHTVDNMELVTYLYEREIHSENRISNLYSYIDLLYGWAFRLSNIAKQQGYMTEDIPVKPEREKEEDNKNIDFRIRSLKQRTEVIKNTSNEDKNSSKEER